MPPPGRPRPLAASRAHDFSVFGTLPDPILVVGMHRSGTSVVAGMLTSLGVFVDPAMPPPASGQAVAMPTPEQRRNGYAESSHFRLLNEAVLAAADAAWDHPEPFVAVRGRERFDCRCLDTLLRHAGEGLSTGFLEPMVRSTSAAWGWKDPRTSLTLPYWLRIFPGARVIHVVRNADSVSRSLLTRAAAWAERPSPSPRLADRVRRAASHPGNTLRRAAARLGVTRSTLLSQSPPMDDARARVLWDVYVRECREWGPHAAGYLDLRFEAVIEDPAATARTLADFAGIAPSSGRLANAAAFVEHGGRPAPAPPAARQPTPPVGGPMPGLAAPASAHICRRTPPEG